MCCDFTPVSFQGAENIFVTARTDTRTHQYYQVDIIHFRTVQTKTFPHQTLDTIALDCVAGVFY